MKQISISALFALLMIITSCSNDKKEAAPVATDTTKTEATDSVAKKKEDEKPAGPNLSGTQNQLNFMQKCGAWDRYKTGILPQMAEEVPEYAEKLLNSEYDNFLIVDKNKMKLFVYDKYGNIVKSYGIACARNFGTKQRKGDCRTSEGFFSAEGIYDSTNWLYTNDAGYTSPARGVYGPRFIRVDIPTTRAIGIHGTSSRYSIGNRVSHGCIRLQNEDIMDLTEKYAKKGMPIIISPGPKDMAVNAKEGHNIPSVTTEPGGTRASAGSQAMDPKAKSDNAAEAKKNAAANKTTQKEAPKQSDKPKATQSSGGEKAKETAPEQKHETPKESAPEKVQESKPAPKPEAPKPEAKPAPAAPAAPAEN